MAYRAVPVAGSVRVNIAHPARRHRHQDQRPGPTLSAEGDALLRRRDTRAEAGGWLAGCGSLPGGLADGFYARLVETVHRAGTRS